MRTIGLFCTENNTRFFIGVTKNEIGVIFTPFLAKEQTKRIQTIAEFKRDRKRQRRQNKTSVEKVVDYQKSGSKNICKGHFKN